MFVGLFGVVECLVLLFAIVLGYVSLDVVCLQLCLLIVDLGEFDCICCCGVCFDMMLIY